MSFLSVLNKLSNLDNFIEIEKNKLLELRSKVECIGLGSSSFDDIGSSRSSDVGVDKIGSGVVKLIEFEKQYVQKLNEYLELKNKVDLFISQNSSTDVNECIIKYRYFDGLTLEEIAEKIDFSYQWTFELHKRALYELECAYNDLGVIF